jgi:hypothetical protein
MQTGHALGKFVAGANIRHLRKRLAAETNALKRQTMSRLLAEEEAKLSSLLRRERTKLFCAGGISVLKGRQEETTAYLAVAHAAFESAGAKYPDE